MNLPAKNPNRVKAGKRSRNKGAQFERTIAKALTKWFGFEVRRTPMSGAYGSHWNLGGDLMFTEEVPWFAELKNTQVWEPSKVTHSSSAFHKWVQKAHEEAPEGHEVIIIAKRNFGQPFFIADIEYFESIGISLWNLKYFFKINDKAAVLFQDFLSNARPELVMSHGN